MPPINQQGSRAGLITGLVTFTILFVTASIFAFNYYGKFETETANYDQYKKSYKDILSEGALQSPQVAALQAARNDVPAKFNITSNDAALDVAIKQRDGLAMIIKGAAGDMTPGAGRRRSRYHIEGCPEDSRHQGQSAGETASPQRSLRSPSWSPKIRQPSNS